MIKTLATCIAILISLAACTTYQPDGIGGGFSETPLAKNVYQIHARGGSSANAGLVRNIALVRAAELTLNNGFHSFIVLEQENRTETSTYTSPGMYNTTTNYVGNQPVMTTTYSGDSVSQYNTPKTDMVVRMFELGEEGSENALDPMVIIANVGPGVGYKGPYLAGSQE